MARASGRALSSLGAILMGLPERKRVDAADERNRRFDDVALAQSGVREGPVPLRSRTIAAPEAEGFTPPSFVPEPVDPLESAVDRFMPTPKFGGAFDAGVAIDEPDPTQMAVGDWGHMETPEAKAARERGEQVERLRGPLGSVVGPDRAGTAAELIGEGVNPLPYMDGPEDGAVPEFQVRAEYYESLRGPNGERYGPNGQLLGESTTPRPADNAPTYGEARVALTQMFPGEYAGSTSLSPQELHDRATKMANGEDVFLTAPSPATPLQEYTQPRGTGARIARPTAAPAPITEIPEPVEDESLPEPREQASAAAAPTMPPEEIDAIRAELAGMEPDSIVAILRRAGASEDEIALVTGSR